MKLEALRDTGLRLPFGDDGIAAPHRDSLNESSTHSIHEVLKPIQNEFLEYLQHQVSISQLSLAVNDSACDKRFGEVYTKGKVLGEGGFALVYQCQHKTNHKSYAVKEVLKADYEAGGEEVKEEIAALKVLKEYPHFVRLLDVFDEPDRVHLVMEEMMGGDLLDKLSEIEVYEEDAARKVSRTLLEAVAHCHKRRIAHRDIKPENILLIKADDITQIKLADFGCAAQWQSSKPNAMVTLCGSPQYVAPEVVEDRPKGVGYSAQCDLWSVGVVIFIILGGYAPFESEDELELLELICTADYEFEEEYWDDVSEPPQELIMQLLEVNPKKRLDARQALNSRWLRRRDSEWVKEMDDSSSSRFGAWMERRRSSMLTASPGGGFSNHSRRESVTEQTTEHEEEDALHEEDHNDDDREADKPDGDEEEQKDRDDTYDCYQAEHSANSFAEGLLTPTSEGKETVSGKPTFSLTLATDP